jgi:hypothetical protein
MTAACDSSPPSASTTSTALALAQPAPLATGEDPATYDDLLARVAAAVKPSDVIEDLWVRDAVDDAWEVLRLRRYIQGGLPRGVPAGRYVDRARGDRRDHVLHAGAALGRARSGRAR